ncbi:MULTISPECIES: DNA-binding transcriptional repressor DeoR [Lonsdalea]|uniref:DNA-binding transcriptional repressor DeoR n=1 Tax=Lonsdalea populi TaxID=1172565 RepID=A0A3N0UIX7_9GAMM|nr:DNA-binding transcriptional repressor DeoR [Lonsdalea populi]QPQ22909.1 DNA-binding transcriptional repressor DeoR [Lonsdalea populi]ROH78466.1 DNA-binding transcriptional repressor DeoR [Lonsdalea populi]ROH80500.1 DNA-binding transcriptional repressor DeoR [Lonsdalea populi]ROH80589.1 DNA-binding transcriptional repressor DeoR [Lonsdalea populi]
MVMRRIERLNTLAQALKKTDKMHLKEAALLLGVSEMTVRRDLNSEETSVMLLGGYVVGDPRSHTVGGYLVAEREQCHVEEKRRAGERAAQLVEANDIIFFDCGTTTSFIIDAIPDDIGFTGVCYSLNTFMALQNKPLSQAILLGGLFNAGKALFTPIGHQHDMDHLCPHVAFISAEGVDRQVGATCLDVAELAIKHRALSASQRNVLVVDNSKFEKRSPARIGELTLFDALVTDRLPAADYIRLCAEQGIQLLTPAQPETPNPTITPVDRQTTDSASSAPHPTCG